MTEASATFSAFDGFVGSLRSLLDFVFSLKQCVPTAAVSLSALAYELAHELCCFPSMHCVGRVHGLSSLATKRFTLLACVHWLQRGGVRYSPFQCFADSSKATQS